MVSWPKLPPYRQNSLKGNSCAGGSTPAPDSAQEQELSSLTPAGRNPPVHVVASTDGGRGSAATSTSTTTKSKITKKTTSSTTRGVPPAPARGFSCLGYSSPTVTSASTADPSSVSMTMTMTVSRRFGAGIGAHREPLRTTPVPVPKSRVRDIRAAGQSCKAVSPSPSNALGVEKAVQSQSGGEHTASCLSAPATPLRMSTPSVVRDDLVTPPTAPSTPKTPTPGELTSRPC